MTLEAERRPDDSFGSLRSCLVEGDPQCEKRARHRKQRAVAVSIALETMALTVLVLYPLLGKSERISAPNFTPIPPYAPGGRPHHSAPTAEPVHPGPRPCGTVCVLSRVPPTIATHSPGPSDEPEGDDLIAAVLPEGTRGGLTRGSTERPVPPPPDVTASVTERRKVSELQQMAQLIGRIQPDYPKLAIEMRREGRVELHAIIATDGTIQSLEVISGDPFFVPSALAAVRQWRYRPTILNGRPVEVDTHITIIYTLNTP